MIVEDNISAFCCQFFGGLLFRFYLFFQQTNASKDSKACLTDLKPQVCDEILSLGIDDSKNVILPMSQDSGYMVVSENSGTPKSSILIGFSIINHPFWGTPIFGNTHIPIITTLPSKKKNAWHEATWHIHRNSLRYAA